MNDKGSKVLSYRITGAQSIQRIQPLLKNIHASHPNDPTDSEYYNFDWALETVPLIIQPLINTPCISFVWETYCEKSWKFSHESAIVLNRLHNSIIIEDKENLAFLQLKIAAARRNQNVPKTFFLETYIAYNKHDVFSWSNRRWNFNHISYGGDSTPESHANIFQTVDLRSTPLPSNISDNDWWVVKASKGNGGKDIWITNSHRYKSVCNELPSNEKFVIQKYVYPPLLYQSKKKFHFRCYAVMMADGSALFYEKGFILTASNDYQSTPQQLSSSSLSSNSRTMCTNLDYVDDKQTGDEEEEENEEEEVFTRRHITNLSVNKILMV